MDECRTVEYNADGSHCKTRRRASWGVFVRILREDGTEEAIDALFGPVETKKSKIDYVGANKHSSHIGECCGISHALLHALALPFLPARIKLRYDCTSAASNCRGGNGSRAAAFAYCLLQQAYALGLTPDWEWVRGHSGDPGNETADKMADRGTLASRTVSHKVSRRLTYAGLRGTYGKGPRGYRRECCAPAVLINGYIVCRYGECAMQCDPNWIAF